MNVPDNAQTVEVEGRDLKRAIAGAAEELGLHPAQVDYKLDMSHFRSITGVSVARGTVRIVAWKSDREAPSEDEEEAAPEPEAAEEKPKKRRTRKPKKEEDDAEATEDGIADADDDAAEDESTPKKRKRRRTTKKDAEDVGEAAEADKPEQLRGAETETTEASTFAQQWFEKLIELMGVEGQVVGTGNEQRVHLAIQAERAGRIVGKRGATLGAIRHLLSLALERRFGGLTVDVDVDGDRERKKPQSSDKPRRERSRDRDRDDRGGRGRGRRGDRDRRPKGKYDEDKLRALARRAAEKALETGKTFTINLQLNSYDRRVVHLEISEISGVDSHSEEREVDGQTLKFVQVVPDAD